MISILYQILTLSVQCIGRICDWCAVMDFGIGEFPRGEVGGWKGLLLILIYWGYGLPYYDVYKCKLLLFL